MDFKNEFNKLPKSGEWISNDKYKKVYDLFTLEKQSNNELSLLKELKNYSIKKGDEFIFGFYTVTGFIKYLGEKDYSFSNKHIITEIKNILAFILTQEKPEKYSYTLGVLFSINKEDKEFYIEQFDNVKSENKLFYDINKIFLKIFIELEINEQFILSFQKSIIDNVDNFNYYSVKEGFEYLTDLNNNNFKKYFLELLKFFDSKKEKQKLICFHGYTGFIGDYNKKEFTDIIENLINKIGSVLFTKGELKIIKNFIIRDIDFAFEYRYDKNIKYNIFINELFKYFHKKEKDFLFEVLKKLDLKYLFGIEPFIVEYLNESQIEDLIKLFKDTDNSNILYFTYDRLKQSGKDDLIKSFEKSSIGDEIKKRNKRIEENNKKFKENKQKELEKEKQNFFKMTKLGEGEDPPRLFQDYAKYIRSEKGLESIFDSKEIEEINKSVKKQIEVYLKKLKISDYKDEKISKILTFEKKQDNSYLHTWNGAYLGWIIDIAEKIKFDLSKYYKSFVLFYPLLWGQKKVNDTLEIISEKLDSKDIDYILRVYSEDLHENAKGLRYFNINTLHDFYEKFNLKFTKNQKNKLEKICLDVINGDDEDNIYYKENFLQIYSKIGGKKKLLKLWNQWKLKYKGFNYFKDYLDDESIDKKVKDSLKFLTFIARELVKTYKNKKVILWSIDQVKNGLIEAIDNRGEYPYRSSTLYRGVSEKESELSGLDTDNKHSFSYIYTIISDINFFKGLLDLLEYSFSTQNKLENGKLKGNYEFYCFYIRSLFYVYIKSLNDDLVNKDYYYKIKGLLNKYDYKITYDFNLSKIKEKFGINDIEEEAKEIIDNEGMYGVAKLLKEKNKLSSELGSLKINNKELKDEIKSIPRDKEYILFVEGITDKIILESAWDKLKGSDEKPFRIENGFCSSQIRNIFMDEDYSVMDSDKSKFFIGMLDFDSAYKHFESFTKGKLWRCKQEDKEVGILIKHEKKNGYLFLLPVPKSRDCYADKKFGNKSILSIELLFDDEKILKENGHGDYKYVEKLELPGIHKKEIYKFSKNKMNFAESTTNFNKKDFDNFNKIFDLIQGIIDGKFSS